MGFDSNTAHLETWFYIYISRGKEGPATQVTGTKLKSRSEEDQKIYLCMYILSESYMTPSVIGT